MNITRLLGSQKEISTCKYYITKEGSISLVRVPSPEFVVTDIMAARTAEVGLLNVATDLPCTSSFR